MGIGEAGELLRKSTVHIRSGSGRLQGTGSGIIWSSTGTIVSNAQPSGGTCTMPGSDAVGKGRGQAIAEQPERK